MRETLQAREMREADEGRAVDARGAAFHRFINKHGRLIETMTYTRAAGNAALQQELRQRALIALWRMDPSRYSDADERLVFTRLRDRMRDGMRANRRSQAIGGIACVSDTLITLKAAKTGFEMEES